MHSYRQQGYWISAAVNTRAQDALPLILIPARAPTPFHSSSNLQPLSTMRRRDGRRRVTRRRRVSFRRPHLPRRHSTSVLAEPPTSSFPFPETRGRIRRRRGWKRAGKGRRSLLLRVISVIVCEGINKTVKRALAGLGLLSHEFPPWRPFFSSPLARLSLPSFSSLPAEAPSLRSFLALSYFRSFRNRGTRVCVQLARATGPRGCPKTQELYFSRA